MNENRLSPLSRKLRMLIREKKLTQRQIAAKLGIPASTLGNYLQGKSCPSLQTLVSLAQILDVSTDYLLSSPPTEMQSEDEEELLRVFRALSPYDQAVYLEQGRVILRIRNEHT